VVLGVQSAEKPPRYVPVAKVRAAMKSQRLESVPASGESAVMRVEILQLMKPEATGRAVMLDGAPEEVAAQLCDVLAARGLL